MSKTQWNYDYEGNFNVRLHVSVSIISSSRRSAYQIINLFTCTAHRIFETKLQIYIFWIRGRLSYERMIPSSYNSAFGHPGLTSYKGGIESRKHVTIFLQLDPLATPACMFQYLCQYYFQSWCWLRQKARNTKIIIMKEILILACMFQFLHQHYSQSWYRLRCKRKNGIKSLKKGEVIN